MCQQDWTGEEGLADALQAMLPLLPHVKWLISTLGSRGSVLLAQQAPSDDQAPEASLPEVMDDLLSQANSREKQTGNEPACTSASGVAVGWVKDQNFSACCLLCTASMESIIKLGLQGSAALLTMQSTGQAVCVLSQRLMKCMLVQPRYVGKLEALKTPLFS